MPDPIFTSNPLEGYGTFNNQGVWVQFNARVPNEPKFNPNGDINQNAFMDAEGGGTGWKIHISAKTPEAIRELAELGEKYKIPAFKLAATNEKLEMFQDPTKGQSGKAAVFYYAENGADGKPINWQAFTQEAQNILDRNGGAGAAVQRDKALPGSDGIFYRHGEDMDGNYRPRDGITQYMRDRDIPSAMSYNLGNRADPFADISVKSGAANVPSYDKIPKDWTLERSKTRGEDFIRRTVSSEEEAKALVAELKDNGIEAKMRPKGQRLFVEITPESEDAFRQLQERQAANTGTEKASVPKKPRMTFEEFKEFNARFEAREAAEKAAREAGVAPEKTVTDSLQPVSKEEAIAFIDKKMAERREGMQAAIDQPTAKAPAAYEMRDNGGAFKMFVSEQYKAAQENKSADRAFVDTDNKLVVSANTPEAMAALEKLGKDSKVPIFRIEEGKATFYFSDKAADGKDINWQEFAQKAQAIAEKSGMGKDSAVTYVIEGNENPFTAANNTPSKKPEMTAEAFAKFQAEFMAAKEAEKVGRTPIDPNTLDEKTYNRIRSAPDTENVPLDDKWSAVADGENAGAIRRPMRSITSANRAIDALKEAGITATLTQENKSFYIEVPASDAGKFRDMQDLQQQRERIYDWEEKQQEAGKPIKRENKLGMPAYEDGKIVWKDATYPPLQEAQRELANMDANAKIARIRSDQPVPEIESARQAARDKIIIAENDLAAERLEKLKGMNPTDISGYTPENAANAQAAYDAQVRSLQSKAGINPDAPKPAMDAAAAEPKSAAPSTPEITDEMMGKPKYGNNEVVWKDAKYPPLVEAKAELKAAQAANDMDAQAAAREKIAAANADLAPARMAKLDALMINGVTNYDMQNADRYEAAFNAEMDALQKQMESRGARAAAAPAAEKSTASMEAPAASEPAKPAIDYRMETLSKDDKQVARIYTDSPESAQSMSDYLNKQGISAEIKQKGNPQTGVITANLVEIQPESTEKFIEFAKTNVIPAEVMRPVAQPPASEFVGDSTDPKQQRPNAQLLDSPIKQGMNAQTIKNSDGVNYTVLDTTKLDFDAPEAVFGKKTKPTLVRTAKPGEEIITSPGKVEESRITAKGGEVIFVNQLPDGREDAYIPRDANGRPNGQQILNEKYEAIGDDPNGKGALFRPKGSPSKLLPAAITEPTVIKDAWGPGNNQFLDVGATLKLDNGRVTGIDKAAFDETWSITDKAGNIVTSKPPMDNVAKPTAGAETPASELVGDRTDPKQQKAAIAPMAAEPPPPVAEAPKPAAPAMESAPKTPVAPEDALKINTPDRPGNASGFVPPSTSNPNSTLGKLDDAAGKAGLGGLIVINAGKAVVNAIKGDTEAAMQYGEAAGTMAGIQAIQTPTVQKAIVEGVAAGTEKIAGKALGELAEKGGQKLLESSFKLAGRQIPVLGAAVSAGFAVKSATSKETLGEGIAEGAAGLGETVGGLGGFVGGEIGREVMNLATYAVTFGNYSGDPSLTRMLMKEGDSLLNPADNANALVSAKLLPLVEKPEMQNKQNVTITSFALPDGSIVSLPKVDTKFPEIPVAMKIEMDMGNVPGSTKTAQIMNMKALALQEQASMNPFGSSKFTDMKPMTDKVIEQMEVYQDSARVALDFSKRFNEESRQKLIDTLAQSPELLGGRKPEDIVPKLDTGESMGIGKEPKITQEQFPKAYEMLKKSVAEGVNPDDLTARQQVEILRAAMPVAALNDLSIWEKAGAGIGIQSDKFVELNAAREEFNKFQKEQYVPYMDKLREFEPTLRSNEKKIDAFVAELNTIQTRGQLAAKEQAMAPQTDMAAEKLAAFQKTDEYKFAQFKIGNLERGIAGTRAAEQKLGKNVDIDEKMEQTLLETRADLLKKQQEFMETGQITRNSFSPAILEPLKPADKQKPANSIDEANMAMAPKPAEKKTSSPMMSEGNTVIAKAEKPDEKKEEPSKRPEDLAAALEKGGFFTNFSKMASEAVNIANSGQLVAGTASDGATRQSNLGTPS
ncbi:MAG: hypothetical protein ACK502_06210 [Alphaproteobacteria bacterium]